jgi:pimeloyl-ACP methyl ester carboxylesterase
MKMQAPAPRGRMVVVDGRRMHLVEAGPKEARPLVLLEAGSFGFSADWAVVQEKLAGLGLRSLAYDRAGLGLSDPGPLPRDGLAIVGDLEKLLTTIGEAGPFIIVGHSMAGLHIQLFAGRNRDKVAGLVFVDAVTPEVADDPLIERGWIQYAWMSELVAQGAALGLLTPIRRWGDHIGLTPEATPTKRWSFGEAAHNRVSADEIVQWRTTVAQSKAAGPLDPRWPMAVVTAGRARGFEPQRRLQLEPATRSAHGYQEQVDKAQHASLIGVRFADAVVRAIVHVNEAAINSG